MKVDSSKSAKLIPDRSKGSAEFSDPDRVEQLVSEGKYNDIVIALAKQLRATYGDRFSDDYYLNYAKREINIELINRTASRYHGMTATCPIQDSEWAGYSYEEILQMEHDGYTIPQEVLVWAHSQHEYDVTAYQMVSDAAESSDDSSTEELNGENNITVLQKNVRECITKSEEANKKNEVDTQAFQALSKQAAAIKKNNENSISNSMKEISDMTAEWKRLDDKSKNGTLSSFEQKRYEELSNVLKNSKSSAIKEIQHNYSDLDEFLSSMDNLENSILDNNELIQDTTKAVNDLSKYEKKYYNAQMSHPLANLSLSGNGLLADSLYGASTFSIQSLAVTSNVELQTSTDGLENIVEEQESAGLKDFSVEYSNTASQIPSLDKPLAGDNVSKQKSQDDKTSTQKSSDNPNSTLPASSLSIKNMNFGSSNQDQNTQNEKEGHNTNFFVFPANGRPEAALLAALTCAISTEDLKNKQEDANVNHQNLKKDLKKTEQEMKVFEKSYNKISALHEANMQSAENYLLQLEMLQTKKAQEQADMPKINFINSKTNGMEALGNDGAEQPQSNAEEEGIISQLGSISESDKKMMRTVQLGQVNAQRSIAKNEKATSALRSEDTSLNKRNKNAKAVSICTTICGGITTGLGAYNMSVAVPMLAKGIAMQASLVTLPAGIALAALATRWIIIASLQLATGPMATVTGGVGIAATNDVSDDIKEHQDTIKSSNIQSKNNYKVVRASSKVLNTWGDIDIPALSANQGSNQNTNKPDMSQLPVSVNGSGLSKTANVTFGTIKDISAPANNNSSVIYNAGSVPGVSNSQQYAQNKQNVYNNILNNAKNNSGSAADDMNVAKPVNAQASAANNSRNEKDIILNQLENIDRDSQAAEKSSDKVAEILKNNLSKSKVLEQQFNVLYSEVQNINDEATSEIKASQKSYEKAAAEVNKYVEDGTSRLKRAANISGEASKENQNISELDMISIIEDVYSSELQDETSEDTNIAAASVSNNVNIKNSTLTDDKADRKLSRFNSDSIIESKKKRKKVMAVSASSNKKA